jgi:hypothetical protein
MNWLWISLPLFKNANQGIFHIKVIFSGLLPKIKWRLNTIITSVSPALHDP